jgi:serine protease
MLVSFGIMVPLTVASPTTWNVPSGACPTIQAGIDSGSAGDTVLVHPGVYNENLLIDDKSGLRLAGSGGAALTEIVGSAEYPVIDIAWTDSCEIVGITARSGKYGIWIRSGSFVSIRRCIVRENYLEGIVVYRGGASAGVSDTRVCDNGFNGIRLEQAASLFVTRCQVTGNGSTGLGLYDGLEALVESTDVSQNGPGFYGGIGVAYMNPVIRWCTITDNTSDGVNCASGIGGHHCRPVVSFCTIAHNSGCWAAIHMTSGSSLDMSHSIVAENVGHGVVIANPTPEDRIECNDVWGNSGAEYGGIPDQTGLNGNISEDPLFCAPVSGDYMLNVCSPCVDGRGCGRMGAFGVGCESAGVSQSDWSVELTTWGAIKSMYR